MMITLGRRRVQVIDRPGDLTPLTCTGCRGRIQGEDHTIVERKGVKMRFHHACSRIEAYDQARESLEQEVETTKLISTTYEQETMQYAVDCT